MHLARDLSWPNLTKPTWRDRYRIWNISAHNHLNGAVDKATHELISIRCLKFGRRKAITCSNSEVEFNSCRIVVSLQLDKNCSAGSGMRRNRKVASVHVHTNSGLHMRLGWR
jgi:hypothetical protein